MFAKGLNDIRYQLKSNREKAVQCLAQNERNRLDWVRSSWPSHRRCRPVFQETKVPTACQWHARVVPASIWMLLLVLLPAITVTGALGQTTTAPASQAVDQSADAKSGGEQELAKKLSNPIASLISVPFQFTYDRGYGPEGDGQHVLLNIQPVIPFSLSEDWNLISRTIVPLIYQDDISPDAGHQSGLGDIVQSFFFSPAKPGPAGIIWGVGPVFLLPTATDDLLGGEKWGAGPTGVILKQEGPWTVGMLANHIWSFAGDDDREDINATLLQPFLSYTTKDSWTFSLNTESTYDWNANEWSIPINFNVSKLLKIGKTLVQIGAGPRYWAVSPDQGPEGWGARMTITFLFPK